MDETKGESSLTVLGECLATTIPWALTPADQWQRLGCERNGSWHKSGKSREATDVLRNRV